MTNSLLRSEDGISALEYILIAMVVALAIIVGATYLGSSLNDRYDSAATRVEAIE